MADIEKLEQDALWMRKRILELALKSGSSGAHLGGSLSLVEILIALYNTINISKDENRDRVILSKGHGALALYTVLELKGIMTANLVDTFETNGTHLFAHASRDVEHGIEFSGGSLGLGISYAIGVAIACKTKGLNNHIYAIVGDGECNEGVFWEAMMTAHQFHLDNLTVIVDNNGLQADGFTKEIIDLSPLADKLMAFGLKAITVNGHNIESLINAMVIREEGKTMAIVANTIKGKGISFMENEAAWHHGVLNQKKYDKAMEELA
ncbi:MAG: transketolase [Bacteroidales bacterium]|nr:transketolase [Bacteroidales bacterium]